MAKTTEQVIERGFARVSMDDLASSMGVSKKTLYRIFPSKKELLNAVVQEQTARVMEEILRLVHDPDKPYLVKLRAVLGCITESYARFEKVFSEDLDTTKPEIWSEIESFRANLRPKFFGELLREGVANGHLRADFNIEIATFLYSSCSVDLIRSKQLQVFGITPAQAAEEIFRIFFEGLAVQAVGSDHLLV